MNNPLRAEIERRITEAEADHNEAVIDAQKARGFEHETLERRALRKLACATALREVLALIPDTSGDVMPEKPTVASGRVRIRAGETEAQADARAAAALPAPSGDVKERFDAAFDTALSTTKRIVAHEKGARYPDPLPTLGQAQPATCTYPACVCCAHGSHAPDALASQEKAEPVAAAEPGWQLVPVEPTPQMIDAHFATHARAETVFASVGEVWAAMLAAAPAFPKPEGEA